MRRLRAPAALLLALAAARARGDAIDDFVRAQMERRHVPGAAIAVVQDRAPTRLSSYGTANLEWETPVGPDTVFAIGSLSKQFAAAATMLLVQDGLLRLDARLDATLGGLPAAWGGVTIRQLLTHTSGIPGYTELPGFERLNPLPVTPEELIARVARQPLLFAPGTRWAYSNTGYYLLGLVVEKISGLPYAEFLQRRIASPAGLAATRLSAAEALVPKRAGGYVFKDGGFVLPHHEDPSWPFSGGGVLSTARDLGRWAALLRDATLLNRTSLEVMWTPVVLAGGGRYPYGFGWHVESYRGRRAIWHTGHIHGFSGAVLVLPANGLAVVVLTNGPASSPLHIARGIASYVEPALPFVERIGTRPDLEPARTANVRKALAQAAAGGGDLLTPGLVSTIGPAQRAYASAMLKKLRGVGFVTCDKAVDGTDVYGAKVKEICTYRFDLGETSLDVDHWMTADGRVAFVDVDVDDAP